ncbi:MAG TPA: UTP--glucose-1-phosphate uridylyltransferase GalU [bacterium]
MSVTKAVFPVGGLGTRFLPATKASPKEMLALVDKPLIQYVVEEAALAGITDAVFVTGRGKRAIEDHFDTIFELEHALDRKGNRKLLEEVRKITNLANFAYVRQGEPLGLGHAILCARNLVGDEPFAVLLGDDIVSGRVPCLRQLIDAYERLARSSGEVVGGVIAVQRVRGPEISSYGVIKAEPVAGSRRLFRVRGLVEKPAPDKAPSDLAIIGRYVLAPAIFESLAVTPRGRGGEVQLTDALRDLTVERNYPLYAVLFEGRRYDAGDKLGFLQATVEFALANAELGPPFRRYLRELLRRRRPARA